MQEQSISSGKVIQLLKVLELPDNCLAFLNLQSYEAKCAGLEGLKKILKKQRRVLSLKHHPDKGGDENRMKEINRIIDWLLDIAIPVPRPQIVRIMFGSDCGTTSTWRGTASS